VVSAADETTKKDDTALKQVETRVESSETSDDEKSTNTPTH